MGCYEEMEASGKTATNGQGWFSEGVYSREKQGERVNFRDRQRTIYNATEFDVSAQ
jgi:hypothetical protein